jgi:hypothetical protein
MNRNYSHLHILLYIFTFPKMFWRKTFIVETTIENIFNHWFFLRKKLQFFSLIKINHYSYSPYWQWVLSNILVKIINGILRSAESGLWTAAFIFLILIEMTIICLVDSCRFFVTAITCTFENGDKTRIIGAIQTWVLRPHEWSASHTLNPAIDKVNHFLRL